jgi:hypothetical protein
MGSIVLAHFEKVVFAGFVSWFLVVGARPLVAHPDDGAGALDDATAAVQAHLTSYAPSVAPFADPGVKLGHELTPPAAPDAFPAWTMHRRPNLAFQPVVGPPPLPTPTHGPPAVTITRVGHGEVVISWKAAPHEGCDITGYDVARSTSGPAGPFVGVASGLDPNAETFTDAAPAASECTYQVTEHGRVAPGYAPLDAAALDLAGVSAVAPVPSDWVVTSSDFGDPAVIAGPAGWACLTVHHWNKKAGAFDKRTYQRVVEGSPIGDAAFASRAVLENVAKVGGHLEVRIVWPDGRVQTLRAKDKPDLR